jgi:hypothetical protein
MLKRYLCIPLLLVCGQLFSQAKTLQAIRITQAPIIDGNLDDAAWNNASLGSDFIQNFPTFGLPASQKTTVLLAYDNSAIYIAAYLYDDPSLIRKQITSRDAEQQSDVDYFSVFLDTYKDEQNGFQFLVTSANVQTDARMGPNLGGGFGGFGDKTWDAVWESKVSIKSDGWVVEMRIPYISLRFAKGGIQNWGLQLLRFIRRNNENDYWSPVNPEINGFINQFGLLANINDIQPPLRLSFSPYLSTGFRSSPIRNEYLNEWLRNGGMDVKYGINESFTLDATLIPDFGQVISDNVVNNLTPYEVRFQENRPFFTEGTELFTKAGLFYSRRIGAIPGKYYDILDTALTDPNIEVVRNPARTQLINGIKLSGRTQKKLGIGIFNAIGAPMHALIRNKTNGLRTNIETEPLANYNILVLDQAFKGRSYLTFTNTNVIRNNNGRDANVSAIDLALYDKRNTYLVQGTARYSKIWDVSANDGFNTMLRVGKVGGNLQYSALVNVESADYDPNDLGILPAPNEVSYRTSISYSKFKPTQNFITYSYSFNTRFQYLYKPYAFNRIDLIGDAFWVFKNFWDLQVEAVVNPGEARDYFELRTPNRYLAYPFNYYLNASGSTDSRKRTFMRFGCTYARSPDFDNDLYIISLGLRYRFSNQFTLDLQTDSHVEKNQLGYAFARELNNEPIVGFRDNHEFITVLTGTYNFTPRLNLTLRSRHYWNTVTYHSFHNVDMKGHLAARPFINGKNQNVNIFNLDAFLTWDFRLGSRIIVGYKNWLGNDEMVAVSGRNTYLHNLSKVFDLRHGNELTMRFIYFLDYNQFRKKR